MTSLLHYYFPPERVEARKLDADFCIYGGNAAGVVAAVCAARLGLRVVLLEPGRHLGGMTASGLGMTDFGNQAAVGGVAREFYQRVGRTYGEEVAWRFEPHVAEAVFNSMLEEAGVTVCLSEFVDTVKVAERRGEPILSSLTTESGLEVSARYFADCSYEGDLMARAGVSYFVGREGNERYGEMLNGQQIREKNQFNYVVDPYQTPGIPESGLVYGIDEDPHYEHGASDRRVQAYNFRMCLTQREDVRVPFPRPAGYNAAHYILVERYLKAGWREIFRKFDRMKNGKTDTNNHGAVSTNLIAGSHQWPEGSYRQREELFQRHVQWQQGFQWFMANENGVPPEVREEMATWGLCADEFCETGGWPHQLYIREARRMVSDYVITEADCRGERVSPCPVGLGAYNMDSHNCRRLVLRGRVWNEGDVQVPVAGPYGIDYRAMVPRRGECSNLVVPVCLSASHIAYGSVRMEPVFMVLGQSAAEAVAIASADNIALQQLPYPALREALLNKGQRLAWPVV